jgi:pyroglutamyl-peptidase
MFGLAVRARQMRIEMRARNAVTRMLPDVSGRIPLAATILPGGPPTVPLRSPAQRLLSAALATGVPAALSRDAGRYLCNYLCWRAAEAAGTGAPSLVAFVHVPAVRRASSQSRRDLLTLDQLIDAGEAILRAAVGAAR